MRVAGQMEKQRRQRIFFGTLKGNDDMNDNLVYQSVVIGNDIFEHLGIMENIRRNEIDAELS
jgi:hypothetical protein